MSDEKQKMDLIREAYTYAQSQKGEDRLTQADIKNAKEIVKARTAYTNAKKMKGEDKVTKADIEFETKNLPEFSCGGMGKAIKGGKYIGCK